MDIKVDIITEWMYKQTNKQKPTWKHEELKINFSTF